VPFVLDASVALAWHFDDEVSPYAEAILDRLQYDSARVPSIWPLEVANGLILAECRGRIAQGRLVRGLQLTRGLQIEVLEVSLEEAVGVVTELAQAHRLTAYDASYLHVAMLQDLPIATQDTDLLAAAKRVGLPELT
jgi:predicted nucleic acid-binding protein